MKRASAIASVAFALAASASLLAITTAASAQGLRDLVGDRAESRGDLRDLHFGSVLEFAMICATYCETGWRGATICATSFWTG